MSGKKNMKRTVPKATILGANINLSTVKAERDQAVAGRAAARAELAALVQAHAAERAALVQAHAAERAAHAAEHAALVQAHATLADERAILAIQNRLLREGLDVAGEDPSSEFGGSDTTPEDGPARMKGHRGPLRGPE